MKIKTSEVSKAMKKAVEFGIFTPYVTQEEYIKNWEAMESILNAALGAERLEECMTDESSIKNTK